MRGIPSLITDIRKNVFTEVARMAYAGGDYTNAEDLPYNNNYTSNRGSVSIFHTSIDCNLCSCWQRVCCDYFIINRYRR